jgi:hypothetical protein
MMFLYRSPILFLFALASISAAAQNYTSTGNGSWTNPAIWNNTSGWGSASPPTSAQGSGTIQVGHDISIAGNYSSGSATVQIDAGKTLTINGDLAVTGGSTINVSGTLIVTGSTSLSGFLNILPGGKVYISSSLTINSSNYLNVGTAAGPPYADLVVYGNVISSGSGDITVNQNGRVAFFGNVTASGGGTLFTVNNGGQVYVHGNVAMSGGGSHIYNNNTLSPYGLYVNGTTSNTGGGSSSTTNTAGVSTMQTTNVPFYSWVSTLPFSPLPVTLLYFKAKVVNKEIVISWATASEKDSDHFVIERSTNGKSFTAIGKTKAHGNSLSKKLYSLVDSEPVVGRMYYRLKAVDRDASFEYFEIVTVQFENTKSLEVFPTLIEQGNIITAQVNFDSSDGSAVSIIDSQGRRVHEFTFQGTTAYYSADLPAGLYFYRLQTDGNVFVQRFVVK